MNAIFHTLGCKVNQYETQAMREKLINSGNTCCDTDKVDAVIINSCTVTAESDRKTRQILRRYRREYPDAVIVLTGCMVQAFPQYADSLDEADIITGNKDISKIAELIDEFMLKKEKIVDVEKHLTGEEYNTPHITQFSERTRAFMKIEDGCNRFCSYCVIPYARGRVRSRSIDDIRDETERLAQNGYSEIVLVGINLSAYGLGKDYDLCDAVDAVCSIEKIKRVRLGSLEPDHISDEMLLRFKAQRKFCPQFHLSLQSGCDQTLKRMNRHYDSAFYADLVNRIRKIFPDASITTDIMVGFAGESDEEFNKSLKFAEDIKFARSHIFVYSKREGTMAEKFEAQVDERIKKERAKLMRWVTTKTEKEFLKSLIGNTYPVLIEASSDGYCEGYTPNYSRVKIKSKNAIIGEIKNVKIISAQKDFCLGEFC